ncbi:MAG: hypothetical protein ABWZ08_14065 [Pseudoxanthomonas sp.]
MRLYFYYRSNLWPPDSSRAGSTVKLAFNRLSETVVPECALPLRIEADDRRLVRLNRIQHKAAIVVCALAGRSNGQIARMGLHQRARLP